MMKYKDIKDNTRLSDLELADVYNAHWNTLLPSPLSDRHAEKLFEALEHQRYAAQQAAAAKVGRR